MPHPGSSRMTAASSRLERRVLLGRKYAKWKRRASARFKLT